MDNDRPDLWIGHVSMKTSDLAGSHDFMQLIGLRAVFRNDEVAICELRGGTHLILIEDSDAGDSECDVDFMVEDIDSTYARFKSLALDVSELNRGDIHDWFTVVEPGGNRITVNSSHVEDHTRV